MPKKFTVTIIVEDPKRAEALLKAESKTNASLEEHITSLARGGVTRYIEELEEKYGYAVDGKKLCALCGKPFRPIGNEVDCTQCR